MSQPLARASRALSPASFKQSTRNFSSSALRQTSWSPGPAPPRLPKEEQEIFEKLQSQSTGAFSTPRAPPKVNQPGQAAASKPQEFAPSEGTPEAAIAKAAAENSDDREGGSKSLRADVSQGDELHPNVRRGAPPEFEGDTNPNTGEVGGPKNEPLRWGGGVDWSYNGRVTDF